MFRELCRHLFSGLKSVQDDFKQLNNQYKPNKNGFETETINFNVESKNKEERYKALEAKFTQNMDLKKVLMITNRAKLLKFMRRKDSIIDMMLMKIRKDIA